MTTTLHAVGLTLTIGTIVAAAAVLQWLFMAGASALSREEMPWSGLRPADMRLVVSSAILAIAWIVVFAGGRAAAASTAPPSVTGGRKQGSCATVVTDMAANVVRRRVGEPDEIRSDEETRGPGAVIWIYRNSRCAVHIFEGRVEFVD